MNMAEYIKSGGKPAQTAEQRRDVALATYTADKSEANWHALQRAQGALTSPTGGVK